MIVVFINYTLYNSLLMGGGGFMQPQYSDIYSGPLMSQLLFYSFALDFFHSG